MITAATTTLDLTPFASWPATGSPPGYFPRPLNEAAEVFYRENGFLVVESAFTAEEVEALNRETTRICRGEAGEVRGLEPGADGLSDEEVLRRYVCIHFPHKLSPLMLETIGHPAIRDTLVRVIGPDVKCMQSMLFIKASGKPGQHWHQDEFYIPTRDRSLAGAWIALDDATVANGCLWVIPGSHRPGIIWPQEMHEDRRFDCSGRSYGHPYAETDAIPVEVKAGSVVFFNGYLLHGSMPNRSRGGYRRSLVNHYMNARSMLPWMSEGKWLAKADYRDIVMVAGDDPYGYKGMEDLARPHVRPSGEGGCGDAANNVRKK
ncbi:MAG: phytanoyl-CoA dioxygenase family protein [Puniceicoccaceae bacterium]|nr:MAG: phytanoyl-CoA dioxygenase family protein [Puniceicoccaceae bacterium]